jgi:membrane-associated phospholipid phosphatase
MTVLRETKTAARRATSDAGSSARFLEGRGLPESPERLGSGASRSCGDWLARLVTNLGSPPVLAVVIVALTASTLSSPGVWIWAGIYLLLAVLLPLLHVVWLVKRGRVTDLHLRVRAQRIQPLLVAITCGGLGWLVLVLAPAPAALSIFAAALWLQTAAILAITLRWKISVHTAAAAGATTVAWALLGTALPFLLTVPVIAWSRIRLRRHTLPQTLAGALLGFLVFIVASSLLPIG